MTTPGRCSPVAHAALFAITITFGFLALLSTSAAQTWRRASASNPPVEKLFASDSLMVSILNRREVWVSLIHSGKWMYRGTVDIGITDRPYLLTSGVISNGRLIVGVTYERLRTEHGQLYQMLGGLYTSDDTGRTWYNLSLRDTAVYSIRTAGADGLIALVSTDIGSSPPMWLMQSSDGGVSWSRMADLPGGRGETVTLPGGFAASGADTLAVVANQALFLSFDSGRSWDLVRDSIAASAHVTFGPDGTLYLLNDWLRDGLYISQDMGRSWSRMETPPTDSPIRDLAATPLRALLVATDQGAWRWTEGSDEWERIGPNGAVSNVVVIEDRALLGSFRGVFSSTDNALTWEQTSEGLLSLTPNSYARWGERTIVSADMQPGASSEDEGETWTGEAIEQMKFSHDGRPYQVVALASGGLAAATPVGVGFLDRDSTTWRYVVPGYIAGFEPDRQVQRISSEVNGWIFTYTGNRMYRGGPLGGWQALDQKLWFKRIVAATPGRLVAAVETAAPVGLQSWQGPGLYFSQNDGLSWEDRGNGNRYYDVAAFADGSIAATTDGIIEFRGENGVLKLPLAIPSPLRASSIIIIEPSTLILGISDPRGMGEIEGGCVIRSDDRGLTWRSISDGLDSTGVRTLALVLPTRLLATTSRGIYYLDLAASHVVPTRSPVSDLTLSVSYKAGDDRLRIHGSRSRAGSLHCHILNSAGQIVTVQQHAYASPGRFDIELSLQGLPSGLYFVQGRIDGSDEHATASFAVVR